MCEHKRLKAVGERIFCMDCGQEVSRAFLLAKNEPKKAVDGEKPVEEPAEEPVVEEPVEEQAVVDEKPAEIPPEVKKPTNGKGRKKTAKKAE